MLPYNQADDCCVYKMTSWLEHSKYESHKERTEKFRGSSSSSYRIFIVTLGLWTPCLLVIIANIFVLVKTALELAKAGLKCHSLWWFRSIWMTTLWTWWPRSFRICMLLFLCVILVTRSDARTFAKVKVPIFSATSFFWLALFSGLEWQKINLVSPVVKKTFAFIWCGILQDGVNWGPSGMLAWLNQQDPEVALIILVAKTLPDESICGTI